MGKKAVLLAGLVVMALFGWKFYDHTHKEGVDGALQKPPSRAVAVAVAPLERRDVRKRRVFTGTLKPSLLFDMAPRVGGRIIEMPAKMGDAVHPGDLLVRLDDEELRLEYDQIRAEVDVARANRDARKTEVAARKKEFDRAKVLSRKKMISDAQYDEAETAYKTAVEEEKIAQAQLRQEESRLRVAEVHLQDCVLRVPQGEKMKDRTLYVGSSYVELGALVKENEALLSLMDIGILKGEIYVTEKDYALVHPGMSALSPGGCPSGTGFSRPGGTHFLSCGGGEPSGPGGTSDSQRGAVFTAGNVYAGGDRAGGKIGSSHGAFKCSLRTGGRERGLSRKYRRNPGGISQSASGNSGEFHGGDSGTFGP